MLDGTFVRGEARPLALLRVDPDVGRGLSHDELARAERRLRVRQITVDPGDWTPFEDSGADGLGLLLVRGILKRTLAVAGLPCTEILSAGDIVRPVATVDDSERSRGRPAWSAIDPISLAVLDEAFIDACRPWPSILASIVGRVIERGHWRTSIRSAIAQTRRIDDRVLMLFWHFSQRWGTVRPDGVHMALGVTHETIGQIVGATRSSVTIAIGRLERRGLLSRPADCIWILHGEAPSFAGAS
jgi:CRP/FNR family cyclic AMP-dependent transcriptional regulator